MNDATGSVERWLAVMQRIIKRPTRSLTLLDLCCNECTATARLKWHAHIGVDVVNWTTRASITEFHEMDVLQFLGKTRKKYDVCICSDGIEHLKLEDGMTLLKRMERVAQLSIIFTPLGPYMLDAEATHPDAHKSAWTPEALENLGWSTEVYPSWHPTLSVGAFFAWKGKVI